MKIGTISAIAATVAAAGLALSATSASAYIACNAEGACWHVHRQAAYNYDPGFGIVVHPDTWRWGATDHYTWREHHGRGYWRKGVWVTF
ncbi:MAG TPA: hypothetical protein VHX64_13845 [Caulobacteraceae bacterium]|jgi:hypothetical protein|nr:hypothetical protein [Caulobacteraceae bacterium]